MFHQNNLYFFVDECATPTLKNKNKTNTTVKTFGLNLITSFHNVYLFFMLIT